MLFVIFVVIITALIAIKLFLMLINTRCKSKVCLSGKTALVTGGNSGIGYDIVLALVSRGCRVIIADKVQDPDLHEKIFRETNSTNIIFKHVDLASFKSVREFAKSIVESEDKLDILIHNAGIGGPNGIVTEDDLNMVMQVNYFSPFLLTHLLVDLLKNASGRIVFTSSLLSYNNNFSLEKLTPDGVKDYNYLHYYSNSKLCLILISDLFALKLREHKITSNSYHPGYVNTRIFEKTIEFGRKSNHFLFFARALHIGATLFAKTPEDGAQTAIYLACANEVKDVTGEFFFETKPTFKPRKAYDEKLCLSTWKASEELVKLESHEKL